MLVESRAAFSYDLELGHVLIGTIAFWVLTVKVLRILLVKLFAAGVLFRLFFKSHSSTSDLVLHFLATTTVGSD